MPEYALSECRQLSTVCKAWSMLFRFSSCHTVSLPRSVLSMLVNLTSFSLDLAIMNGVDVDFPRNLAKVSPPLNSSALNDADVFCFCQSVTVE